MTAAKPRSTSKKSAPSIINPAAEAEKKATTAAKKKKAASPETTAAPVVEPAVVSAPTSPETGTTPAKTGKTAKSGKGQAAPVIGVEQRSYYVEVAAYHIAERRGFTPGDPLADWLEAEAEIDRLIAEGKLGG